MSMNPPARRRTTVLLQLSNPLDTEAYAMRLKSEPVLAVRTDNRAAARPDVRLADQCVGPSDAPPTLLLTRRGEGSRQPPCACCERLPAGLRWDALIDRLHTAAGNSPPPATLDPTAEGIKRLTPRERDVLALVGQGKTIAQCAEAMGVAESTIGNHKYRLMRKLGVNNSLQLLRIAVRHGLADFA